MKIGLLSFADCNNYGAKHLAPLVYSYLNKLLPEAEIVLISPTGAGIEGDAYTAYDPTTLDQFTALVLVGGEVTTVSDQQLLNAYNRKGLVSKLVHPTDLIFASPNLKPPYKMWLSTGVSSNNCSAATASKLARLIPQLNRLILPGSLAKNNLEALTGLDLDTEIMPDLGWLIPFAAKTSPTSLEHLAAGAGTGTSFAPALPYLAFQPKAALLPPAAGLAEIAATLQRLHANTGLQIVLLPGNDYAEEYAFLRELNQAAGDQLVVLPAEMDRHLTAQVLMHAAVTISSSLPEAITSLAAGVPAGVIHPVDTAFYDLFGMQQRLKFLRREWSELSELCLGLLNEPRQPLLDYSALQRAKLEALFKEVAAELQTVGRSGKAPKLAHHPKEEPSQSFRREEEASTVRLNQSLENELALINLRLTNLTAWLEPPPESPAGRSDFPANRPGQFAQSGSEPDKDRAGDGSSQAELQKLEVPYQEIIAQQTIRLNALEEELARTKKTAQALNSQVLEWKTRFETLQDTRTVRLTRNLKIISSTLFQATRAPFEEFIQGKLNPPELEKKEGPFLTVYGWATSSNGHITSVEVFLEGVSLGEAYYGLERPDVLLDRPLQLERYCGFAGRFKLDLPQVRLGSNLLGVTVTDSKGHVRQFCYTVFFKKEFRDLTSAQSGFEVAGPAGKAELETISPSSQPRKAKLSLPAKPFGKAAPPGPLSPMKPGRMREVKLFVAKEGNIFMQDIARIFQYGFSRNGLKAEILVNRLPSATPPKDCLQLVIAPHEFYPLFLQKLLGQSAIDKLTQAVFLLNVEQPHSQWFEIAAKLAYQAAGVWDINRQGVNQFEKEGILAQYSPLGYAPFLAAGAEQVAASEDKPIDLLYLGSSSPRREKLLAGNTDFLNHYHTHLVLNRVDRPRLSTTPGYVDAGERTRLLRQSKILLNLHYSDQPYFEWHRALVAMANRCLLVTEQCENFEPLVPSRHFGMAPAAELAAVCQRYLDDPAARQAMVEEAYRFVTTELDAGVLCRALVGAA